MTAARVLTDEELEAMLERAAEKGAERALAKVHAAEVEAEVVIDHVRPTAATHAFVAKKLDRYRIKRGRAT